MYQTVANPEISDRGCKIQNVSAQSSFVTNANNELYTFCVGKGDMVEKFLRPTVAADPTTLHLNLPLVSDTRISRTS